MDTINCDGATLGDSLYTGSTIPPLDQKTVECNLTRFVEWLNKLTEQVNYLSCLYLDMKAVVQENRQRIECLEGQLAELTERVNNIDTRLTALETLVNELINGSGDINSALNVINNKLDFLYDLLPIPYGMLPGKGWKFAMGNINVMSANNGTPSTSGPGIFTSDTIEDNDLYFN